MLRGNGGTALEQKDINVNVFSAAPQTRSGEKVFNPNISSAVPQACAAKRAPTYSERLDKLRIFADEAAEELPQVFYRELNGGIILSPITKAHQQSDPKKPLLVLGEYAADGTEHCVVRRFDFAQLREFTGRKAEGRGSAHLAARIHASP